MATSPANRRQVRSTWVTGAALSLIAAAGAVGAGMVLNGPYLMAAAVAAVVLGVLAARLVYRALADTRREAQRTRSQQARDYLQLATQRSAENSAFVRTLTERLADRQRQIHELAGELELSKRDLETSKKDLEATRGSLAGEKKKRALAVERIATLEQQLADLKAELVAWEAAAAKAEEQRARRTA